MKLLFKQRFFSWFGSYDIFDEAGETVYTVKGELAWGHKLRIFDRSGNEAGLIQQKVFAFLPRFEIYINGEYSGSVKREFTFFTPNYTMDFKGWRAEGSFLEWDYHITDSDGNTVATVSKELFNWTDTYSMDIEDPSDALSVLMLVLAIDAEKCSRD